MEFSSLSYEEPAFEKYRSLISWIVDILVIVILAFFVADMFGGRVAITGHSMEGVLNQGEAVLIDCMTYKFKAPARNDIICFYLSGDELKEQAYVKRIIGLPGETVQIKNGYVYIDGEILDEDNVLYEVSVAGIAKDEILLGDDEYFVLGDNRASSEDSRFDNVGLVGIEQIEGRVWFRVSPFERLGVLLGK